MSGILLTYHFAGYNALHLAVTQSNVKVIRRLCNIGCDINMQVSSQHIQWGMICGIYLAYLFSMWRAFSCRASMASVSVDHILLYYLICRIKRAV